MLRLLTTALALLLLASCATTPPQTQKLLGQHDLSLQWIGWEPQERGKATVKKAPDGTITITGRQDGNDGDFLSIDGTVTNIGPQFFTFNGTIKTRVSHLAGGRTVTRQGTQRFGIYGNRDYWRMENLNNPEDNAVDYIDIHFR